MGKRKGKLLIFGLIGVIILGIGYLKISEFLKIDSCLDKGGRWNYETNECEYAEEIDLSTKPDSLDKLSGYNELADEENRGTYTISEYNTDITDATNIDRPKTSQLIDVTFDTSLLFNIWTLDPDGPHADFWIKRKEFYVVDYDGDGRMPYILNKDSLTIYYNDFKQTGKILKVTMDSLIIKWSDADAPTEYLKWKD